MLIQLSIISSGICCWWRAKSIKNFDLPGVCFRTAWCRRLDPFGSRRDVIGPMTVRRMLPSKRSLGSASSSIAISQSKSGFGFIDKNWETETSIDWFIEKYYFFCCVSRVPRTTSINFFGVGGCSPLSLFPGLTLPSTLSTEDFTKILELFLGLRSTISSYSTKAEVWLILELDLHDFY